MTFLPIEKVFVPRTVIISGVVAIVDKDFLALLDRPDAPDTSGGSKPWVLHPAELRVSARVDR